MARVSGRARAAAVGVIVACFAVGAAAQPCTVTLSQTEGPYYLNLNLVRRDIKETRPGLPIGLIYQVRSATTCQPVPGAVVDVWHTDAAGTYSGIPGQGTGGQTWLRGTQVADANGIVLFDTIFPGWYPGRTTHIHLKVKINTQAVLTTQYYFPDWLPDLVYLNFDPYRARGARTVTNAQDSLWRPSLDMLVVPPYAGAIVYIP